MILFSQAIRIYVAVAPVSLRQSFDGLSNQIREVLVKDPVSGHVFVFINRRKNQVKLMWWTRGGFTILHKRLEKGTFAFAQKAALGATHVAIDIGELSLLLEGISVMKARKSERWAPNAAASTT